MDLEILLNIMEEDAQPSENLETEEAKLKVINYSFYKPKAINFIAFNPQKKLVLVTRANSTLEI